MRPLTLWRGWCEKMTYKENPKMKGSGIVACIPQKGICPNMCGDCFFQSGRSYLEPLKENLPNVPEDVGHRIVRVNDGNDSGNNIELVLESTKHFKHKFYNTADMKVVEKLKGPTVLTINPALMTDYDFQQLDPIPENLMFVRFRANTWNLDIMDDAIGYYTSRDIPLVVTFMAYHEKESIPDYCVDHYIYKKRTLNSYWVLKKNVWQYIAAQNIDNHLVDFCGKTGGSLCRYCGNCLKHYFACLEKLDV